MRVIVALVIIVATLVLFNAVFAKAAGKGGAAAAPVRPGAVG